MRSELRVLGPLELLGGEGAVHLPGRKHRRLLAALALADGRSCSTDTLVDALWGESPPASAPKLLQVYVSQLRKALPAGIVVVTRPAGYALDLDGASLDAERFERLVEEAGGALEQGNPALAASLAEQALALWRGPAYADVRYEEFAQGEAERLEELRLVASETLLDAQLRLGRHDEALGEILALADEHPLREREQELAMLALYRAGRQVDALERYAALRSHLDEELGLEPGPRLRELQRRILEQDPTLDVSGAGVGGSQLPASPNALVGREDELDALCAALLRRDVRLLVLTGSGGSGKTRLALEAARRVARSFANGAALVELAPLRDPGLIVPAVAHAVELGDMGDELSLDELANELRARELLLVLDNAEHLRAGTAAFVELLARAPRLTLLVTSRAVLHLSGEHVFPVAPLDEGAAVELFAQRARALQPSFQVTGEHEAVVREICARVDRLPLAIELAAARIRTLEPRALLERLAERLTLLSGGPHDMPARQQTLRETLDWSFDLLAGEERLMLARLSVFPSGATLEAAAEVCLDGDEDAALELVERLLDASLLHAQAQSDGGMRYTLLETVRQYAADRLRDVPGDETPRRHAEWCLALAEAAEPELGGDQQTRWFAVLEAEHDNLRAALAYLGGSGEDRLRLRLAVALSRFWYVRGYLGEGRRRLEEALVDDHDQPPPLLRRALTAASAIALLQGDYAAATAHSESALDAARRGDEPRYVANALSNLGAIVLAAGDHARAAAVLEEAVALARAADDTRIAALAINNLGDLALTTGDYERARPLFEESHELLSARGDTANLARSQFNRGAVDLMVGDHEAAGARFREGLRLANQTGDTEDLAWCLEGLAAVAAEQGDGERASVLLGVAGGLLRQMGADFKPFERQLHDVTETRARALCGIDEHGAARERGESMTLAAALDLAMGPAS